MSSPAENLRAARERKGYPDAESAAAAMGVSAITYRAHENGWRGMSRAATRYARFFGIPVETLLEGSSDTPVSDFHAPGVDIAGSGTSSPGTQYATLRLVGVVAGGLWREVEALDQSDAPPSPIAPDPRWPATRQYALRVDGDSINRVARHGDLVAVVDVHALEAPPPDGALVVVEETRDDGALVQTTAKRLRRRASGLVELHADSDDPRWRDVRLVVEPGTADDRPITTRIAGLVVAVHRPLA